MFEGHDFACVDGIECQALAQCVRGFEPPVPDPGACLKRLEILLYQPSALVPGDDLQSVVRRGFAFGGEQQPVERIDPCRRVGLENPNRKHAQRRGAAGTVFRRHEIDRRGADFEPHARALSLCAVPPFGFDSYRLVGNARQSGRVRPQLLFIADLVEHASTRRTPTLARTSAQAPAAQALFIRSH